MLWPPVAAEVVVTVIQLTIERFLSRVRLNPLEEVGYGKFYQLLNEFPQWIRRLPLRSPAKTSTWKQSIRLEPVATALSISLHQQVAHERRTLIMSDFPCSHIGKQWFFRYETHSGYYDDLTKNNRYILPIAVHIWKYLSFHQLSHEWIWWNGFEIIMFENSVSLFPSKRSMRNSNILL